MSGAQSKSAGEHDDALFSSAEEQQAHEPAPGTQPSIRPFLEPQYP